MMFWVKYTRCTCIQMIDVFHYDLREFLVAMRCLFNVLQIASYTFS